VLDQCTQDTGGAGFVRARDFEFLRQVIGQLDYEVALRLVGVVVVHIQGEVGQDRVANSIMA
jgi:hypothetical protein